MNAPVDKPAQGDPLGTHLGLWDAVSIIVGIVVGTAIFRTPPLVFSTAGDAVTGMAFWALGGILVLAGSMCYAELTTTYPQIGGDYVYLSRAFGRWAGFQFGWAQLTVILTGSIGAMAYAFADYALALWQLPAEHAVWFAAMSVVVLTLFNLFGVVCGKTVQNILSLAKILGLVGIIVVGLLWGSPAVAQSSSSSDGGGGAAWGLALVFVLYAYGGWNDAAFVAAEVRNRKRNLPLALVIGTGGIMVIYLLVNAAYLRGLGYEGVCSSPAPAAALFQRVLGPWGSTAISLLVMVSALGAINGMIFTGSRIYVGMGADHRLFAWLGQWNARRSTPLWSLLLQSLMALLLIVIVGTTTGQAMINGLLQTVGTSPIDWDKFGGGFGALVAGSAPVFWVFFLLTGISLPLLRWKDHGLARPFSAPLYPLEPIVLCTTCVYMAYSAMAYAEWLTLIGIVPLLIGIPVYWLTGKPRNLDAD